MVFDRLGRPIITGSVILGVRVGDINLIREISHEFGSIWLHYEVLEVTGYRDAGFRGVMEFENGREVQWFEVLTCFAID